MLSPYFQKVRTFALQNGGLRCVEFGSAKERGGGERRGVGDALPLPSASTYICTTERVGWDRFGLAPAASPGQSLGVQRCCRVLRLAVRNEDTSAHGATGLKWL